MPGQPRPLWDRFWSKVDMSGGLDACWPWLGAKSHKRRGTRRGVIQESGRGSPVRLAHVVALALSTDGEYVKFHPDTGERLQACHRCNAPQGDCSNPRHLYWGTRADNDADRYGRQARQAAVVEQDGDPASGAGALPAVWETRGGNQPLDRAPLAELLDAPAGGGGPSAGRGASSAAAGE